MHMHIGLHVSLWVHLINKIHILQIEPQLQNGRNIVVAAHGNSLRSIIMYLEKLTSQEVIHYFLRIAKWLKVLSSIRLSFICLLNRLPIWNYLLGFHYFTYTSMGDFWRGAVLLDLRSMEFMLIPGYELSALCCTWSCHLWIFHSRIFNCLFRSFLVCRFQLPSKASMTEEIKSLNFVCFALHDWNN